MSQTTLIEAANRVLLDVGERSVTSLSASPAGRKVKAYLQEAFNDFQMFHNWEWAYSLLPVNTFNNEKTTIDNVRRIRAVFWNTDLRSHIIHYTPYSRLLQQAKTPFNSEQQYSTRPVRYARLDERTLIFDPYPTDEAGRDKIRVEGLRYFQPPVNDQDTFGCPERYMGVVLKRATYMMYMRHLGDLQMAQYMEGEYMVMVQMFKSQESLTPTRDGNMFKGART